MSCSVVAAWEGYVGSGKAQGEIDVGKVGLSCFRDRQPLCILVAVVREVSRQFEGQLNRLRRAGGIGRVDQGVCADDNGLDVSFAPDGLDGRRRSVCWEMASVSRREGTTAGEKLGNSVSSGEIVRVGQGVLTEFVAPMESRQVWVSD